jgi:putative hydrolase of the HAD superfamily
MISNPRPGSGRSGFLGHCASFLGSASGQKAPAPGVRLPPRQEIDAVIFDAGGVLLLPDPVVGREAVRPLGYEPCDSDWASAHYAAIAAFDKMEPTVWSEIRRAFAAALGIHDDHLADAVSLIESLVVSTPWVSVDGAAMALRTLGDAGFRLTVVSNAFGTIAEQLATQGVCSVTDTGLPRVRTIIDSYHVGIEKPDPRIFQLALDSVDVPGSRSVYVGGSVRADVAGAIAAGLEVAHLDPCSICKGDHPHFDGLAALVNWLVP